MNNNQGMFAKENINKIAMGVVAVVLSIAAINVFSKAVYGRKIVHEITIKDIVKGDN